VKILPVKILSVKILSVKILLVKIFVVKILVGRNSVGQMYQNLHSSADGRASALKIEKMVKKIILDILCMEFRPGHLIKIDHF
jgi:hypothetical protein